MRQCFCTTKSATGRRQGVSFMDLNKAGKKYAPILVRYALSFVFLWFGLSQLADQASFLGYLPQWTYHLPIAPSTFVLLNGAFETLLGVLLACGLFTRAAALLLGLHLVGIAVSLGYNDIAIRDVGLALATLAIFLQGSDDWCLERRWKGSA